MYLALESIVGNTFVNDAAAYTVGGELLEVVEALADCVEVCVVVFELLLPQPTTSEPIAIAATAVSHGPGALRNSRSSFVARQYLGTLLESWKWRQGGKPRSANAACNAVSAKPSLRLAPG